MHCPRRRPAAGRHCTRERVQKNPEAAAPRLRAHARCLAWPAGAVVAPIQRSAARSSARLRTSRRRPRRPSQSVSLTQSSRPSRCAVGRERPSLDEASTMHAGSERRTRPSGGGYRYATGAAAAAARVSGARAPEPLTAGCWSTTGSARYGSNGGRWMKATHCAGSRGTVVPCWVKHSQAVADATQPTTRGNAAGRVDPAR